MNLTWRLSSRRQSSRLREAGLLFADRALAGHIHHKNATDFVTEVDTGVQELMRRRLAEIPAGSTVHGRGAGQLRARHLWPRLDT